MRCARCANDAKSAAEEGVTFLMQRQHVYQLYRNLVNQPNGFFDRYMLMPKPEESIIDPIALLNLSTLTVTRDAAATAGRRSLNQTVIHWRPPPGHTPRLGESEQLF
jgi:hypothetical protein